MNVQPSILLISFLFLSLLHARFTLTPRVEVQKYRCHYSWIPSNSLNLLAAFVYCKIETLDEIRIFGIPIWTILENIRFHPSQNDN